MIDTFLERMMTEYQSHRKNYPNGDTKSEFWTFLKSCQQNFAKVLDMNKYVINFRYSQGSMALVPCLGIKHRGTSTSLKEGIYVCYLLSADGERLYLTLNQGCENKRSEELKQKVDDCRKNHRELFDNFADFTFSNIDLASDKDKHKNYEKGCFCSIEYRKGIAYKKEKLESDLYNMLNLYDLIVTAAYSHNILDKSGEMIKKYILHSVNTILYGPPGTGKTYNTKRYAVATCGGDMTKVNDEYIRLAGEERIKFVTFHQSYGYEEFIQGIAAKVNEGTHQVEYTTKDGVFVRFCEKARGKKEPYIFIIDEINRGNISKIFGELITLIEDTKREGCDDAQSAELPHGGCFSVPNNVYILGTMNTADRSIAMLDTALRRRFDFIEMMPKPDVLEGVMVENVEVDKLLESINARIEFLFDREHTIGHAFFTSLLKEENRTIETLKQIFRNKVIPLLQEYFYDDYKKIQQVLGASFVKNIEAPLSLNSAEVERYTINASDHWNFTECFEKTKAETKQDETE